MNLVKLQNELADDEGIKYELYLCSESHLTGGIGHLITEWDKDYYDKPVGTPIPNEQQKIKLGIVEQLNCSNSNLHFWINFWITGEYKRIFVF